MTQMSNEPATHTYLPERRIAPVKEAINWTAFNFVRDVTSSGLMAGEIRQLAAEEQAEMNRQIGEMAAAAAQLKALMDAARGRFAEGR